jgi:hypothetical protein
MQLSLTATFVASIFRIERGDFTIVKNQIRISLICWCHNASSKGDAHCHGASGHQKLATYGCPFHTCLFGLGNSASGLSLKGNETREAALDLVEGVHVILKFFVCV